MSAYLNVSTSPHTRSRLSTGRVMWDVVISLIPVTAVGIWHYGTNALLIILTSIATAVITEVVFDKIAHREKTWTDGSAVVTGLLLALCLSPTVPVFIPVLGSLFAILFVKCFFGGLGKNFMNPAVAGRCFLLISFSGIMTSYAPADAISSATPVAELLAGKTVNLTEMFLGNGNATGVIGCSIAALLIGGLYLLVIDAISLEIPLSMIGVFVIFVALFGGHGLDPMYIVAHLCGGGVIMGAFFMATDPVTSPVTTKGHLIYGGAIGLLAGIFRIAGSAADSVAYSIIIGNLLTPLIDEYVIPVPYGLRKGAQSPKKSISPKLLLPAVRLCLITLLAGIGLAAVFNMTKENIENQKIAKQRASYLEVLPSASDIENDESLTAAVESLAGKTYGSGFGRVKINDAARGVSDSGENAGYVVNVTSSDGFDGDISLSVGVDSEGTIQGIAFTELAETAGMGMRCAEPEFKDQFAGRSVEQFILNKGGGSQTDEEIDSVSGASISSGAVVNAVNAALDFLRTYAQ